MDAGYSRPGRLRTHTRRRFFLGRGGGAPSLSSITISGLAGISSWPAYNRAEHVQPVSSVVVNVSRFTQGQATITLSTEGVVDAQYSSVGGVITVPAEAIETAVNDRKMITLVVDGNTVGGYIIFLPKTESEPFSVIDTILKSDGLTEPFSSTNCTDFVDVTYATDIVYTGRLGGGDDHYAAMVAYDENYELVKTLISLVSAESTIHVVPDGTYKYIKACSSKSVANSSLQLIFPDRRRSKSSKSSAKDSDPGEK